MRIRSVLFLLAAFAAPGQYAFGHHYWVCGDDKIQWVPGHPRFRPHIQSFPEGYARTNALDAVVRTWNNSPADFRFDLTWNEHSVALSNDENEIWFTDDSDLMDGAPAVTFNWDDCGAWGFGDGNSEILEKDVLFACPANWACATQGQYPNPVPWYYGSTKTTTRGYGGTQRPFRTTAMHELGHALGLLHEDDVYNIMGTDWTHMHTDGNIATAYPGEDASDGAVHLYDAKADPLEDVSVVHWRYSGANNGYSTHARTRITDANGVELPTTLNGGVDGLRDYRVNAGQRIRAEFTFENNGSTTQPSVEVAFYLSHDRSLGFDDRLLAQVELSLSRGYVYERFQTIDLPDDLVSGEMYYILAIVDPLDRISERNATVTNENNNMTYSRRFVVN